MRVLNKHKVKASTSRSRLSAASSAVLEPMEKRMLFSGSIVTAWNFNALTVATNLSPAASTGTGTASSVGMQATGTSGVAPYPTTGAVGPDASAIVAGTGSSGGSSDGTTGNIWRVVGTNGWNTAAAIGTQGAQFNVSTAGESSVTAQFDLYSTTAGEGHAQVEYTTNSGTSWVNVPAADLGTNGSAGVVVSTNSTSTNTVSGAFFNISGGQGWYNQLQVNLSSISAVNNDAGFGLRIVNASTGADDVTVAPGGATLENNTSGNWRFDEVQILGVPAGSTAPSITTNPANVEANGTTNVSFTAIASGTPSPTVQWQVSTNAGTTFSNVSGATSTTYTITGVTPSLNGNQYRAMFSNVAGSVNSSAATLTVPSVATVVSQPSNQTISVPSSVTFTASGFGQTIPSVQWKVSNNSGSSFSNVAFSTGASNYNSATGVATYTYTPTVGDTGDQFEAVFTSGSSSATTNPATLTVNGPPITAWTFPTTVAPPIVGANPNIGVGTLTPLGMTNDYTGADSQPVDDVTGTSTPTGNDPTTGMPDYAFTENLFRVRGGSGGGTTGTAGTPDGWSGFAPSGTQGLQISTSTSGYSNVSVHYDWYSTTSGPKSGQLQYTLDGSTWVNYGSPLTAFSNSYYGANPNSAPTGVTLNLQGVTGAANNSNFAVRMVSVYQPTDYTLSASGSDPDNALPAIYDDNLDINNGVGYHGQYATADPTAAAFTSQEIQIGGSGDTGNFTLTVNGLTTAAINYDPSYGLGGTVSNMATAIQSAIQKLGTLYSKATVVSLDGIASNYIITFPVPSGTAAAITGPITANAAGLTGSYDSANQTNAGVNVIYAGSLIPYTTSGSGNWRFGNISVSGTSTSGAPGILTEPASQTISLPVGGGTASANFSASAYSETGMTGVQWYISTNNGAFTPIAGATSFTANGNVYSTTYTFSTNTAAASGTQLEAVFTNNSVSATTTAATVLVVIPSAPSFSLPGAPGATVTGGAAATVSGQPQSSSAVVGNSALFTAEVTGLPLSSSTSTTNGVQWEFSSNGGTSWTPVVTNANTTVTTTIANLASGYQTSTSVLSVPAVLNQSGFKYEAIFTNAAGQATSLPVTLNVLASEPVVAAYTFGGNSSTGVAAAPDNTPSADATSTASSTLLSIGFNDPNFPSVTADDVALSAGTIDANYTANTWRIRGGTTASTPGAPANGWDYLAPQYSQGAELDLNTTGLQNIYIGFQWYTTAQGVRDAQEQYNLNVNGSTSNWVNINAPLIAANGGDYYGSTNSTTAPTGALIDLTGIAGAANNPNFGIRLVAAYDPYFGNQYSDPAGTQNQLSTPEPRGQYAAATLVNGNPVPLNGSSGNWRFANITVSGSVIPTLPVWLSASPGAATFTQSTETLIVTGAATIIGDPAASGDSPNITVNGGNLAINPTSGQTINIGGLTLINGGIAAMTDTSATTPDVLIIATGGTLSIAPTSMLDLGDNFIDIKEATAAQGATMLTNVSALVASGYTNNWTGHGITSSTAAADATHLTGVGSMFNNGVYGSGKTFDTITPGQNDVLLRYTYYGDANLDAKVDGSDYSLVDNGFNTSLTGWYNGDFNYDGVINGSDYTLIDNAFNRQNGTPLAEVAAPTPKAKSPFASGSPIKGANVGTIVPLATSSIEEILKRNKRNIFAGKLLDSPTSN